MWFESTWAFKSNLSIKEIIQTIYEIWRLWNWHKMASLFLRKLLLKENLIQFSIGVLKTLIRTNLMMNWKKKSLLIYTLKHSWKYFSPLWIYLLFKNRRKYSILTTLLWLNNLGHKLGKDPNHEINLTNLKRQKTGKNGIRRKTNTLPY